MLSVITVRDYHRCMELRHLATFVAVAEERSFSRAAERLQVVQSAVSATIRALEREWGVRLFHRTTHRVELSVEGRALLGEARAALRAADGVRHAVDEVRGGLRGTLRLGILQSSASSGPTSVGAVLAAFRIEHPGVDVVVRQGGSLVSADAVRAGELDLAFLGLPDEETPGLRSSTLRVDEQQLACPAGHPFAQRADVALEELAGEPFADVPPTWGVRLGNDRAFAAAGVPHDVTYEINDLGTVVDFVRHGLAVACMPPRMVDDPRIAFVPLREHAPRFVVSLVAPADRPSGPVARAFVAVAERLAAEA